MREHLDDIDRWLDAGKSVALATVVRVWGSAPRPLGAKLAVSSDGDMVGSVSGGCIEAAVIQEARQVMRTGRGRLVCYEVPNEKVWAIGLPCGGTLEVFIEPLVRQSGSYLDVRDSLHRKQVLARAVVVAGEGVGTELLAWPDGRHRGGLGSAELDKQILEHLRETVPGLVERRSFAANGGDLDLFLEIHAPPPKLVIIGAVHVAIPLVHFAAALGYQTVVIDPRKAFARPERFEHADDLLIERPERVLDGDLIDASTCVAVLSHDLKFDVPALAAALNSNARYIGALGSSRTHAQRVKALRAAGFDDEQIARIRSPIGLDLGGRRAEELALSIMAQIVAEGHGHGT